MNELLKKTTMRRLLAFFRVFRVFRMLLSLILMWIGYPVFLVGVFIGWGWSDVKKSWRDMP